MSPTSSGSGFEEDCSIFGSDFGDFFLPKIFLILSIYGQIIYFSLLILIKLKEAFGKVSMS